jgi:molybdopterin adenylyltransferase
VKAAIITVSTSVAAGRTEDLSGEALAELAAEAGAEVVAKEVVSDDRAQIEETLRRHSAPDAQTSFIFTTGGTGLTSDDVTPEATRAVIDRDAPGIAEAMRAVSLEHTPMGLLSRGVSGIAGRTLIVNFPGNPKAIRQLFGLIAPVLGHADATLNRERGARTPGH